jgi:hypothetical protein
MSFIKIDVEGSRADPDRVYYNATVINNSLVTTQSQADPEIDFEDQRQTAIISDASMYEVSVQSFSLDGCQKNFPLFIPQMAVGSNTQTIYSVTVAVKYGSTYNITSTPITWIPENQATYIPTPPATTPQIQSEYYYCYTYSHFITLVNKALNTAWTTSKGIGGTQCPFFEYDETTGLFALNQDSNTCMVPYKASAGSTLGSSLPEPWASANNYAATNPAGATYQDGEYTFVGMNTSLELLLSNFPSIYYGNGQKWANQSLKILPEVVIDTGLAVNLLTGASKSSTPIGEMLKSLPKTSIVQLANPFTGAAIAKAFFVRLKQDYSSTGSIWSPIASIVLGTSSIPVRNEYVANPIVFGTGTNGGNTASGGAFGKVLLETPIGDLKADDWRTSLVYQPQTLTFSSLDRSQEGISDIDLQVYWRNRLTNSLIRLTIPNQASLSFRLLFKKKLVL